MLHPTIDKLRRLRLIGMAKALEECRCRSDLPRKCRLNFPQAVHPG
jgi:hypothetical protein